MTVIIVTGLLGLVVGWTSHDPLARMWSMMVHGQARVIQHREPKRQRKVKVGAKVEDNASTGA